MQPPACHPGDLVKQRLATVTVHRHRPVAVEREHEVGEADLPLVLDDGQRGCGYRPYDLPLVLRPACGKPPDHDVAAVVADALDLGPAQPCRLGPSRAGQNHELDHLAVEADALVASRLPHGPDLVVVQDAITRCLARLYAPHAFDDR